MDSRILLILACTAALSSAWSLPYYPVPRAPMRFTRFAPPPPPHLRPHFHPHPHQHPHQHHRIPVPVEAAEPEEPQQRPKRGHDDYDHDHDHDHDHGHHGHRGTSGVTGPVHTFVKTDKNANYKWGVRHHVGDKYAS
ncbi:uncharacterized protein LOC142973324 [Anticarsia gemmatalis]|uniref:uncharacterized protein LOC142973324 n=1 Tax=Anticarsia gemmatalis TaxID=129554 RepID=UPI003F767124